MKANVTYVSYVKQIAYKKLIEKNENLKVGVPDSKKIKLPFIVVNTSNKSLIRCEMSENRCDIFFNFSHPFQIHDDNEILKMVNGSTPGNKRSDAAKYLPANLIRYLPPEYQQSSSKRNLTKVCPCVASKTSHFHNILSLIYCT